MKMDFFSKNSRYGTGNHRIAVELGVVLIFPIEQLLTLVFGVGAGWGGGGGYYFLE